MLFVDPTSNKIAERMQSELKRIVKNQETTSSLVPWFHAYIFVFDVHEKDTYEKLLKMITAVREIEKSA